MPKRSESDEAYVIGLCDAILNRVAQRGHRFLFLRGDANRALPVDAYYADLNLVVEYRERQHFESVVLFDKRMTVSGVPRGEQRKRYDQMRRDVLPANGIHLIEIDCTEFPLTRQKRLERTPGDIDIVRNRLASAGMTGPSVAARP